MAAITIGAPTRTKGNIWTVASGTAQANTGQTTWVAPPSWATRGTIWLSVTAAAGTTPLTDFSLLTIDPSTLDDATALNYAGWDGITQIAGTTSGNVVIYLGAAVSGTSDDDTGPAYVLNAPIPSLLGFKVLFDRTTGNETYTYTVRVEWSK